MDRRPTVPIRAEVGCHELSTCKTQTRPIFHRRDLLAPVRNASKKETCTPNSMIAVSCSETTHTGDGKM